MRGLFIIIALTSVVSALLALTTPLIMKFATDWVVAIVGGEAFEWAPLLWLIGAFVAVSLLMTVVVDVGGYYGDQMAIRTRRQLSTLYYEHLLTLPQRYYDGEVTGKIINRLSRAITDVSQFLQFFANNLFQMLLTFAITIGVLAWYYWPLAVLFVLLIPSNLFVTALSSGRWQRYEGQKNTHFDIASGRFAEVVGQMRLVKSFGSEQRELGLFDSGVERMVGLTERQSLWWHGMNALRTAMFRLLFAAMYGLLFYQTARGRFTVGDMVLLLTLIQKVAFPMHNINFFVDSYQRAVANSKDYLEAMAETPEGDDEQGDRLAVRGGSVEFRDVAFHYEADKPVLSDVSFTVRPGQKVALVGESGGGKTTIANLLMRLYEPDSGEVLVDGTDIASVTRSSVRQQIATVFQDAALFSGTIRDNIAYARPDASDDEVEAAARVANAHEFISKFPDGYASEIGERGIKLSGGQKQRIAIARAVLKDAPLLILDEATSALDSRAEHDVQQALERLMKGRTTLIIAHRLSTIAHVDSIVTLRDGRVDEIGSPAELAKTDGIYAQLLALQTGATEKAKQQLARYDIAG